MAKVSVEAAFRRAQLCERRGDLEEARSVYQSIISRFPNNMRARHALEAIQAAGQAAGQGAGSQETLASGLRELGTLWQQRQIARVASRAAELVKVHPGSAALWNILGAASHRLGQQDQAEAAFLKVTRLDPGFAEGFCNLGNVQEQQGRLAEATASYRQAVRICPDKADIHNVLGAALKRQGMLADATESFRQALRIAPDRADIHVNLGGALLDRDCMEEALASFARAVQLDPELAEAHCGLGTALARQQRTAEAIGSYREAIRLRPEMVRAHNDLGNVLLDSGEIAEACACFAQAASLAPGHAEVHSNLAVALFAQGRLAEAQACCEQALRLDPRLASALTNLGSILSELGKLDEAVVALRKSLEARPDHLPTRSQLMHQLAHMCDWDAQAEHGWSPDTRAESDAAIPPFAMLAREDDPERQQVRARNYARLTCNRPALPRRTLPQQRPPRLRVGYFSGHFHDHATLYLASGLLREHDRSRFEIFAYSYGAVREGELRAQAARDVDHFVDISEMHDRAVADLARGHDLHIAIDLMGYTQNTRSRLFAYGLAPIQINYLVYPGTMGADFMDYIVADPVVIPPAQRSFYSEEILFLPHSYQPNDNRREIADVQGSRADFGLPARGFVFCCFNNNYKIGPREFDIWMRLLERVEGSVLWLLRANRWSEANLRDQARKRGIDPDRLVFADRLPHAEHLARHRHADLFVDTFNYNAHTTASDALWSGLPLVTKAGRQFSARVAASLLHAAGLPELVVETEAEYEALILELASDPERLAGFRSRLAGNRLTHPLFDTAGYARDFERLLDRAFAKKARATV